MDLEVGRVLERGSETTEFVAGSPCGMNSAFWAMAVNWYQEGQFRYIYF